MLKLSNNSIFQRAGGRAFSVSPVLMSSRIKSTSRIIRFVSSLAQQVILFQRRSYSSPTNTCKMEMQATAQPYVCKTDEDTMLMKEYIRVLPHNIKPMPVRPEFHYSQEPVTLQMLEAMDIGLEHKHVPETASDRFALAAVKALRKPSDWFFDKRYVHRALLLETVAAVPGAVAGMSLHLRALRRLNAEHCAYIIHLNHEAENERFHLLTWLEIARPNNVDRFLVWTVQKTFLAAYSLMYALAPKTSHRLVGYLEEEAIVSYTNFAAEIDAGNIENIPAPQMAIEYWNLSPDARLKDVVLSVRADEASHRDFNHEIADQMEVK